MISKLSNLDFEIDDVSWADYPVSISGDVEGQRVYNKQPVFTLRFFNTAKYGSPLKMTADALSALPVALDLVFDYYVKLKVIRNKTTAPFVDDQLRILNEVFPEVVDSDQTKWVLKMAKAGIDFQAKKIDQEISELKSKIDFLQKKKAELEAGLGLITLNHHIEGLLKACGNMKNLSQEADKYSEYLKVAKLDPKSVPEYSCNKREDLLQVPTAPSVDISSLVAEPESAPECPVFEPKPLSESAAKRVHYLRQTRQKREKEATIHMLGKQLIQELAVRRVRGASNPLNILKLKKPVTVMHVTRKRKNHLKKARLSKKTK